jgi:hypothetical protein
MYDEQLGRVVKVSEDVPKIASQIDGVFFKEPRMEYFGGQDGVMINSKGQLKAEMKARGLCEYNERYGNPETHTSKIYSYDGMKPKKRVVHPPIQCSESAKLKAQKRCLGL